MLKIKAIGVSEGLARAKALVIRDVDLTVVRNTVTDIEAEQQRALEAVENAKAQIAALRAETEKNIGPKAAEIFDAHLMMLEDPDFVEGMTNEIADESVCAEFACMVNCENFQAMFRAMDDEYMQARAADIGDISMRVLKNLKGIAENPLDTITEPCIVVANDLTPSDTAKMGGKPVVGFITKIGGRTSHSAIMARSMGIPAVVGAGEKLDPIEDGMELLIDGAAGELIVQPDEETLVQFAEKKAKDDDAAACSARNSCSWTVPICRARRSSSRRTKRRSRPWTAVRSSSARSTSAATRRFRRSIWKRSRIRSSATAPSVSASTAPTCSSYSCARCCALPLTAT